MIALVTMKEAKDHLHESSSYFDSQIDMYIWVASDIVLTLLKIDLGSPEQLPWPQVPARMKLYTLQLVATQFYNRETTAEMLSDQFIAMIRMDRLPTLA